MDSTECNTDFVTLEQEAMKVVMSRKNAMHSGV